MDEDNIESPKWDLIVDRIQKGLCVPFLGAAANVSSNIKYLFSWDDINNINDEFINYLNQEYCFDWLKPLKIEKINNNTVNVSSGTNFLSLILNNEQTKVNLVINNGKPHDLNANRDLNNKLNVYKNKYEGLPVGPKVASELVRKMDDFLFDWNKNDFDKFKKIFEENLGIKWIKNATVTKINNKIIMSNEISFLLMTLEDDEIKVKLDYLLCWDKIEENNLGQLIEYLKANYDINLMNNVKIKKSNNEKAFILSDDLTFVSLYLHTDELNKIENEKYKYIKCLNNKYIYKIKIDDNTITELIVKNKNEFGIYLPSKVRDPKNLAHVSLQYEQIGDRGQLISALKKILPDSKCDPSPLILALAKLPFKLIITTNYDRLLERAFLDYGKDFEVIVHPNKDIPDTPEITKYRDKLLEYKGCIIYKIHGSFIDEYKTKYKLFCQEPDCEDEDPLIVTEDDYIRFLTFFLNDFKNKAIPSHIFSMIKNSTLLFLGYSLEDWDFRILYHNLIKSIEFQDKQKKKWIAIQKDTQKDWKDFWQKRGIDIYNKDIYKFSEELMNEYKRRENQ